MHRRDLNPASPAAALLSTAAIRARCANVAAAVSAGASRHFRIDRARLGVAAAEVEAVTRSRYPDLRIPYHSRWRHFEVGGIDRAAELSAALAGGDTAQCVRARIDLTVVSVLLDAGAGPGWSYREAATGQRLTRSEGLGVASFRAFMDGAFSARRDDPQRVDAAALATIDAAQITDIFQAGSDNPLVGIDGRAALLRRLGGALRAQPDIFGVEARPGALYDTLRATGTGTANAVAATAVSASAVSASAVSATAVSATAVSAGEVADTEVAAPALLRALLDGLGSIWLAGNVLDGVPLGDAWRHPHAGGDGITSGWVPFHKLSQWLAYSLFEPLESAGLSISDRDALTGLPEYRNGGLLIDTGVLSLVDPSAANGPHNVGSELVVEWRALTVTLIDELATLVRARLGTPHLPLACILEGGTWAAGRVLAQRLRGGEPPLTIRSDGTVF